MRKKEKLHGEETLLYVCYTHADYRDDANRNLRRGWTGADLVLEKDPNFTNKEMQTILHAAKMAAIKCLMERK